MADLEARLSEYLVHGEAIADDGAERARLTNMEKEGLLRLGSGTLRAEGFFEKERPEDPEGLLVEAALEEREESR